MKNPHPGKPENALCMLFTAEQAETAEDKKYNAFEISGASQQDCLFFSACPVK